MLTEVRRRLRSGVLRRQVCGMVLASGPSAEAVACALRPRSDSPNESLACVDIMSTYADTAVGSVYGGSGHTCRGAVSEALLSHRPRLFSSRPPIARDERQDLTRDLSSTLSKSAHPASAWSKTVRDLGCLF
jgi:hypothetical protein